MKKGLGIRSKVAVCVAGTVLTGVAFFSAYSTSVGAHKDLYRMYERKYADQNNDGKISNLERISFEAEYTMLLSDNMISLESLDSHPIYKSSKERVDLGYIKPILENYFLNRK